MSSRIRHRVVVLAIVSSLGAAACATILGFEDGLTQGDPDAGGDVNVTGGPCDPSKPFAKQEVPGISTLKWATLGSATLSPDEQEIYFNGAESDGGTSKLYIATRSSRANDFGGIRELPIGNDGSPSDQNPSLFSNRLKIVFSRQPGNFSSLQIFIASRSQTIDNFSNAQAIGNVNSDAADQTPFISADARELWFSSSRSDLVNNKGQLFRALASGEGFGEAQPVAPPNASSTRQEAPVLSADGKALFYSGDGDGGYDQNDIWEARWDTESASFKGGLFVAELSSAKTRDYPSWVSRDGCRLYVHTTNADGKATILVGVRPP